MQKNKKSKGDDIDKLRLLLDNLSKKDLSSEDKKYLDTVVKRLEQSSGYTIQYDKDKNKGKSEIGSLEPKVRIHLRDEKIAKPKKIKEDVEVKIKKIEPEKIVEEDVKETSYDDDLIEVKKVDIKQPQFLEVIPKGIIKEEAKFEEKINIEEEGLTEWEPVEAKKEIEEVKEIKEEKKEISKKKCLNCGLDLEIDMVFCPNCGFNQNEEIQQDSEIQSFIEVTEKPKDKKEEIPSWEPVEEPKIKEPVYEEVKEEGFEQQISPEEKIDTFKDINSIDSLTAILLYDSGYITKDSLTNASVKELAKVKGISRKKAKDIKKELEKILEWDMPQKEVVTPTKIEPIAIGDTAQGKIKKEEVEDPKERQKKIDTFKDLECVDETTAILLYNYGFTRIESLHSAKVKDLSKINGVSKKTAKQIIKEIEKIKQKELEFKPKPIDLGDTAKGNITEEHVKNEKELVEKEDNLPAPVEFSTTKSEWKPVKNDVKKIKKEEPFIDQSKKIEVFKDINSIDDLTAILLYDNGFTNIDSLSITSVKDISKIKGINKKTAKEIKKELEQKMEWKPISKDTELLKEEFEDLEENNKLKEAKEIDKKIQEYETEDFFEEDESNNFKTIKSIDKNISKLLQENGINTVKDIYKANIKDLTKIRGIRKKLAQQIKKEVNELYKKAEEVEINSKTKESYKRGENPFIDEKYEEWESYDEKLVNDTELEEVSGFRHGDYTLYEKEITTKTGDKRVVKFFSKGAPEEGNPIGLPKGFEVKENKKTKVPYLKKKK